MANQLKYGVILGYIDIFLVNAMGLFITPFIISSLGDAEYGLYALIGSLVAYLSLMDFGLNNAIIRFVSRYRALNDVESERKFLGSTMILYAVISTLVIIAGLVTYANLDSFFSSTLTADEMSMAKTMMLILIFNIAIALPCGSFNAICTAHEHFVFPKVVKIVRLLLRAAVVVAILTLGGNAISLVIIDTIFNITVAIITYLYTRNKLGIRYNFSQYKIAAMLPIISYSIWIFFIAISQYAQYQLGTLVIGTIVPTTQIAIYSIGIMLGSYFGAFATVLNSMLLPSATKAVVNTTENKNLTHTMIPAARYNNIISMLVLSGFILFGKDFIFLWLNETYEPAWQIALFIMISNTVPLSQSMGMSILESKNKIKFRALFNTCSLVAAVCIGFYLSRIYGFYGMNIAICSALILNSIAINIYFKNTFDFKILFFFKSSLAHICLTTITLTGFTSLLKRHLSLDNTWLNLGVSICIYTLLFALCTFFLILTKDEKASLYPAKC